MQTCFSSDDFEDLPIACTILVHEEDRLGNGTIWSFYPGRCHVESAVPVSPGMTVSLSLHGPGAVGVRIERGMVTWVGPSEFGLRCSPAVARQSYERSTP